MGFFKRARKANYEVLSAFDNYLPGFGGTAAMLGFFLVGLILGTIVELFLPSGMGVEYRQVICYPLMFIPAMIFARSESMRAAFFQKGYALDSSNFGKGPVLTVLLALVATIATGFLMDGVNSAILPPLPKFLEEIFKQLTGSNIIINLLAVSIMAPVFEEWLMRGIILRGLLNHPRKDGSRGYHPAVAIGTSALLFGVIHFNPWQALPAIAIGVLMGYVYYKTGSLKLTMGMHCLNNTLAVIMSQLPIESLEEAQGWNDIFSAGAYAAISVVMAAVLVLAVWYIRRIPCGKNGNCNVIEAM